jgi:hypothetical protein
MATDTNDKVDELAVIQKIVKLRAKLAAQTEELLDGPKDDERERVVAYLASRYTEER